MSFEQKIDKILKANALGINYPSALEEYLGLGTGTITKPLGNGKSPGKGTIKKIIEKLRINQDWWETGKGEIFLKPATQNQIIAVHPEEGHPPTLLQILLESVRGVNKLVDANNGLVDKLDKDKNWALAELEKLHAKFGVPKES